MEGTNLSDPSMRFDSDKGIYRVSFDPDSESASDAIVWTLAEITGQEVDDMGSLESVVDPIVLDALVRRRRQHIQVSFAYDGYDVTVESYGEVIVQSVQSDGGAEYTCSVTDGESPSEAVIHALAAAEGVDPLELDTFYDRLDPDALDTLIDSSTDGGVGDLHVSFRFDGKRVTVFNDRRIVIRAVTDG